jgi:2',3'-cyclic-nucleotide 2'-phosphodiesterase
VNILYLGDIVGEPGIEVVKTLLPKLRQEYKLDLVIAQGENVSGGKGLLPYDMKRLQSIGVDFFSGGNHTPVKPDLERLLIDNTSPVIGPANMKVCPGRGWKYFQTAKGPVLVISLLGETFSSNKPEIDNPLLVVDQILDENKGIQRVATIVNIHGDYSSEKVIVGFYLDGRVSAVIGDHWHVQTADARILPSGTAHITDVGMCGVLNSSLGVKLDVVIPRWRDGRVNRNLLEDNGPLQINGLVVELTNSGLCKNVTTVRQIIER